MRKEQLFLLEFQSINVQEGNRKFPSGKHHHNSGCIHRMHQWTLRLIGKVKAENRIFSEFQNISPQILIHYKGKIKLYSVETCQMPQSLSDRLEMPVLSETGPSGRSHMMRGESTASSLRLPPCSSQGSGRHTQTEGLQPTKYMTGVQLEKHKDRGTVTDQRTLKRNNKTQVGQKNDISGKTGEIQIKSVV